MLNVLSRLKITAFVKELTLLKKIAIDYGHLNSVKTKSSVDKDNNPLPWYTYPAIEFLTQFDYKNKMIFEWGSGNSSIFWADRAKKVISVEDKPAWYQEIKSFNRKNLFLKLMTQKKEYIETIRQEKAKYDVIVIDAKYRSDCSRIAYKFLKRGGIIIFDNSERYPKTCEDLRKRNSLIQVDFSGFGPINSYTWTTSLFFKGTFDFKTIEKQPHHSIGSLKELCE
jgi:hypothetical protein